MTATTHEEIWREPQRRRVVRLCAAISGDRDAAEDLAQETLLEAWRNRHKLHDPAGGDRWLAAIARNVCLRRARRAGRELPVVATLEERADLEVELERAELVELLDRALALLSPEARDVLVHRYVNDLPHAEIAELLGISGDAVSMRLARGKVALRRVLERELGDAGAGWQETRVWCTECGGARLEMQREPASVAFRCRACGPGPTAVYDLANPFFARLVGTLVRPSTILERAADWGSAHFAPGARTVDCVRCGHDVSLRREQDGGRRGLRGACPACGDEVWSSVHGVSQSLPEARAFRRDHPRARITREWSVEHDGVAAEVVRFASPTGAASLDVLLARETFRVLATHA